MTINELYNKAIQNRSNSGAEDKLFKMLSVRFHTIAHQRIWNDIDADDVAQEALIIVVRGYRELEIETSFSAWAAKVLDYRIMAYIKRKGVTESRLSNVAPNNCADVRETRPTNLKRQLADCLKKLYKANPRYARIINLHYQGYTVDEVCEKLNIKIDHSYVILSRARKLLAECLNLFGGDKHE